MNYKIEGHLYKLESTKVENLNWGIQWKTKVLVIDISDPFSQEPTYLSFTFVNENVDVIEKLKLKPNNFIQIEFNLFSVDRNGDGWNVHTVGYSVIKLKD